MTFFAAIKKAEGPIPELRPPKDKIAFDIPESAIINGAMLIALGALLIGRVIHARRPLPPKPPEPAIVLARRALEVASGPTIIQDCVQIVRRYLFNAFGVGWDGATNPELCVVFATHPRADADSLAALESYFNQSDIARFASHEVEELAVTCVSRALALVEYLEVRRAGAATPEPVAT